MEQSIHTSIDKYSSKITRNKLKTWIIKPTCYERHWDVLCFKQTLLKFVPWVQFKDEAIIWANNDLDLWNNMELGKGIIRNDQGGLNNHRGTSVIK